MTILGDVLSEGFQLKAQLIRAKYKTAVCLAWLIMALICLIARLIVTWWIFKLLNAPSWVWILTVALIPINIIVDQIWDRTKNDLPKKITRSCFICKGEFITELGSENIFCAKHV